MIDTSNLKPCPFCRSKDYLAMDFTAQKGIDVYFVKCSYCLTTGPIKGSEKAAADAWNERPNNE